MVQAAINRLASGESLNSSKTVIFRKVLSPKSIRDVKGALGSALESACKEGLIQSNSASKVDVPKLERRDAVFLSAEEAVTLIESSREHNMGPMNELGLCTGLRLGEITGLQWQDINCDDKTIRVRRQLQRIDGELKTKGLKTKLSARTLSLNEEAIRALSLQSDRRRGHLNLGNQNDLPDDAFVFTTAQGNPLDGTSVDDVLKVQCAKAGIQEVSFHKLRHTTAILMMAAGVPPSVVKDQLGHATISITVDTYGHAMPGALREASNKISGIFREASLKQQFLTRPD